mmetsp:Transcript_26532/g.78062  ORF Transcript_26532/g.78062 Transcript_26532/m.78062 type:complete len:292 (-) Transcript_26532:688-1563(-)
MATIGGFGPGRRPLELQGPDRRLVAGNGGRGREHAVGGVVVLDVPVPCGLGRRLVASGAAAVRGVLGTQGAVVGSGLGMHVARDRSQVRGDLVEVPARCGVATHEVREELRQRLAETVHLVQLGVSRGHRRVPPHADAQHSGRVERELGCGQGGEESREAGGRRWGAAAGGGRGGVARDRWGRPVGASGPAVDCAATGVRSAATLAAGRRGRHETREGDELAVHLHLIRGSLELAAQAQARHPRYLRAATQVGYVLLVLLSEGNHLLHALRGDQAALLGLYQGLEHALGAS